MSKKFFYPAIFESGAQGFSVHVPDIPGCMTQGGTLSGTLDMIQEAIGRMLEGIEEQDYPAPSNPAEIPAEHGKFVMMVCFDKMAYDRKYNAKAVKKTLSIPAWLNEMAIKRNINFSNLLQNALMKELNV